MDTFSIPIRLDALTVDERLALIEAAWASLSKEPDSVPVPDWHLQELDRRAEAHGADPLGGGDWTDVRAELRAKLA